VKKIVPSLVVAAALASGGCFTFTKGAVAEDGGDGAKARGASESFAADAPRPVDPQEVSAGNAREVLQRLRAEIEFAEKEG
jgi:hypothetical protein